MAHIYKTSTWEVKAEPEVRGHPHLCIEYKASLDYIENCLLKKKEWKLIVVFKIFTEKPSMRVAYNPSPWKVKAGGSGVKATLDHTVKPGLERGKALRRHHYLLFSDLNMIKKVSACFVSLLSQ